MSLELVPASADAIPRLSVICHEAFSALHDRFGIERDIPSPEVGEMIIGQTVQRPDYAGVMAVLDGEIVGSNFLSFADEVAGVGPITVDPKVQSKGIGRALMQWVIDEARRRELRQVRLFQEAINTTSLSLYTALGFDWRDTGVLMEATPARKRRKTCSRWPPKPPATCRRRWPSSSARCPGPACIRRRSPRATAPASCFPTCPSAISPRRPARISRRSGARLAPAGSRRSGGP